MNDERRELMVRAAWLYHVEDMTQAEVAERLGMTRRAVNEALASARETGLVRVRIVSGLADCIALERQLERRFGLEDAVVVPTPVDPGMMHEVIGRAAGEYLSRLLARRPAETIGIGWGQTLRQTALQMPEARLPGLTVRSVMGGLSRGTDLNTFDTVRAFATRLGAQCSYFTAPIYADSPASREIILAQPVFRDFYEQAIQVDIALISAGDVSERSSVVCHATPPGSAAELSAMGAVGEVICRFIDAQGHPVDHPLNQQVLAPEFDEVCRIPTRILASGGAHKHAVLLASMRAGLATVLVTDAETAGFLLAQDHPAT